MKMKLTVLCFLTASVVLASCTTHSSSKNLQTSPWNNASSWYQSEIPYDSSKIDVFYMVSTNVISAVDNCGNTVWQSQLTENDRTVILKEMKYFEKNIFYDNFNFSSPIYRQYTFNSIICLSADSFELVHQKVASEVCEAFDYFMENINHGRPFILAGFSQGAMLTLDILKHMTDEQYARMIATYAIGYRLTAEDLKHPHIKAAQNETDRGVVISFNSTQSIEAAWDVVSKDAAACINPINWRTDTTAAYFSYKGTHNKVHIDKTHNTLIVRTDNPDYYKFWMKEHTFYADAGVSCDNLHHWDALFYGNMIHDNAVKRAKGK